MSSQKDSALSSVAIFFLAWVTIMVFAVFLDWIGNSSRGRFRPIGDWAKGRRARADRRRYLKLQRDDLVRETLLINYGRPTTSTRRADVVSEELRARASQAHQLSMALRDRSPAIATPNSAETTLPELIPTGVRVPDGGDLAMPALESWGRFKTPTTIGAPARRTAALRGLFDLAVSAASRIRPAYAATIRYAKTHQRTDAANSLDSDPTDPAPQHRRYPHDSDPASRARLALVGLSERGAVNVVGILRRAGIDRRVDSGTTASLAGGQLRTTNPEAEPPTPLERRR